VPVKGRLDLDEERLYADKEMLEEDVGAYIGREYF
jgi:hypothetical protein